MANKIRVYFDIDKNLLDGIYDNFIEEIKTNYKKFKGE